MANTSEVIRSLARSGATVSEIAAKLNIRYQHAYKVCRDAEITTAPSRREKSPVAPQFAKPKLTVDVLRRGGFIAAGRWEQDTTRLICPANLPKAGGVYAFSIADDVVYIGLASRSLAQRLYFYGNPGASQRTNIRLNAMMREVMEADAVVDIHYACPPALGWNGFTISGPEGLEAGLIQDYYLPWNVKGA